MANQPESEVTPKNPRCPICGAVDWFGEVTWDYGLLVVKKGTTEPFVPGQQMMLPVEGYICRVCRFVRLSARHGTLVWPDPENQPQA